MVNVEVGRERPMAKPKVNAGPAADSAPTADSITDYDRKIVYARIGDQLRVAAMVDIVGFDPAGADHYPGQSQ